MTPTNRHQQVEQALTDLHHAGTRVRIAAVAKHTGIGRATLYRHPELIALIHEHRTHTGTGLTLTGLNTDIAHLPPRHRSPRQTRPPPRGTTPLPRTRPRDREQPLNHRKTNHAE